jgi:hypothetical protein
VRQRDERVVAVRPALPDYTLHRLSQAEGGGVGEEDEDERLRAPAVHRDGEAEREPYEPPAADAREPDEDVVERRPPVLDDPPFDVAVQRGASCFVRSISCCRSKGLPTNACAPRLVASRSACSSSFPLNMTTGIAPAP